MEIKRSTYKNAEAVVLENEQLRVSITPNHGARTASIVYKPLQQELLWQNPDPVHAEPGYGAPYDDGEFAGFDEMFPTISRCCYEHYPWQGIEVPDHGEVWSIPWSYAYEEDGVRFSVNGVRFPYRLEKKVYLRQNRLCTEYRVENLSSHKFSYIWAAHPLFNTEEGMEIIVPPGMKRIINSVQGEMLGGYGERYSFPRARLAGGREVDLSRVPARNKTGYQKYYFDGKAVDGWCLLHSPKKLLNIGLSFPIETVPYLGMWVNEGGFGGQYNIAPEPATAPMDRIDCAEMWGGCSVLEGKASREWYLTITLNDGQRASGMDEAGSMIF